MASQRASVALTCFRLVGTLIAAAAIAATALLTPASSPARAQEEPPTLLRIDAPTEPVSVGDTFQVQLVIENVEHLGAFQAFIDYDHRLLSLESGQMEPLFVDADREDQCTSSPHGWVQLRGSVSQLETELNAIPGVTTQRSQEEDTVRAWFPASEMDQALDAGGEVERTRVFVNCFTTGAAVSLGGPPGVSGSGPLASVTFEALAGGTADLTLSDTELLLDDVSPPGDPESQVIPPIPHVTENASLEIVGGDDRFPWLIVIIAAGVAALVIVLGGGLYLRTRSANQTSASADDGFPPPESGSGTDGPAGGTGPPSGSPPPTA